MTLTEPSGSGTVVLPDASLGGSLGGNLSARDGALETAGARVDQFASDLAAAVNTVHEAGFGLDGSTGNALFSTGTTVAGAAANMTVAITSTAQLALAGVTNAPGDAQNANALLATESAALTGGEDATETLSDITSQFRRRLAVSHRARRPGRGGPEPSSPRCARPIPGSPRTTRW